MGKIWEFYENLDDFVYVSDMDSYELLYLNKKAREAFGLQEMDDPAGRKCYEVLQNCAAPCSVCTNSKLQPGHFVKWNYYNPVLDKHLLLVDTMVIEEGRRCRFEVALENSARRKSDRIADRYENLEMMVNNIIGIALQKETPDETIGCLLEFLGQTLGGERVYIFERNADGGDDNTYEWVAAGVTPQQENLQNLPPEVCAPWYRQFHLNRDIVIHDLDQLRELEPLQYDILKQQDIHSLIVVPLNITPGTAAFYGIDNPRAGSFEYATGMLYIMAHFIEGAIKRRNLVRQLQDMSFRDQQTGFGNRYALRHFAEHVDPAKSMGVLFCDITGLKKINDTLGHKEGDMLISRCANYMRQILHKVMLFRFGGDELVALCPGTEEQELLQMVERLKAVLSENDANMSIGLAYAPAGSVNLDQLMSEAEVRMYEDKSLYYQKHGIDRRRR